MLKGVILKICSLSLISSVSTEFHRNLTAETAPGCKSKSGQCNVNVFYVKATGESDTIHYLWDFTGKPSLLLAHTNPKVSLIINWNTFLNQTAGSVQFSSPPNYCFLLVIDELIEFEDNDDTGFFTSTSKNMSYSTEKMKWSLSQSMSSVQDHSTVSYELIGTNFTNNNLTLTGATILQLTTFDAVNHDSMLPRLLHSANSSQVKLILQDLNSNAGLNNSRWAVKLIVISSDPRNASLHIETRKNLDDENSPGVFTIVNVVSPESEKENSNGAYLQWRPVVYTARIPSISNSSDVGVMDLSPIDPYFLNGSLAMKLFNNDLRKMLIQSTIVSFGASQDGFYKKTNFSSWVFLVSYGSPQFEGFSMLVILVMAIGLGLPAVLIIVGGVFMCHHRFSRRKDELSLER